jgi:hypothetical protein
MKYDSEGVAYSQASGNRVKIDDGFSVLYCELVKWTDSYVIFISPTRSNPKNQAKVDFV